MTRYTDHGDHGECNGTRCPECGCCEHAETLCHVALGPEGARCRDRGCECVSLA